VRRWKFAAGLPAVAAALALAPAARADNLANQHITSTGQVLAWSGSYLDPTGQGYNPATDSACTATTAAQQVCDTFTIRVDLDLGYAMKPPVNPAPPGLNKLQPYPEMPGDGLLVAVRWPTDFDQWNLYVDGSSGNPANALCQGASACGVDLDSNSQSVLVTPPAGAVTASATHWHATYTVKVVAFYTDFDTSGVDKRYQGRASIFLDPSQRQPGPARVMLPKIHTVAPNNFHVSDIPPVPSNPTGWRYTPSGTFTGPLLNSCYLDETVEFGSTRCLRFDNDVRNIGEGPLALEFNYDASALQTALQQLPVPAELAGGCKMNQELLHTNATSSLVDAGPCVFHTQHMHFHYQNFGRYQLFRLGPDGNPHAIPVPGGRPSTPPVSIARKVGFCTIDVDNYTFGMPAAAQRPRTFSFPTCNVPNGYASPGSIPGGPSAQYVGAPEFMGISAGWGDIYTWDLPAQYIDISSVPDGVYEVVSSTNFDGRLQTAGRGEETGVTCVQLKTDSSGATAVKVVREFPSQPNDAPLPACQVGAARTGPATPATAPTVGPATTLPDTAAATPRAFRVASLAPLLPALLLLLVTGSLARARR
jgi:hypothetical protein